MKVFTIAFICSQAFLVLLPFTSGEFDHQMLEIEEKGTKFAEEVEIDERKEVEVFRVPAHNDVIGAEYFHDFKMRMSVTRILSRKICYVSEMEASMSEPRKLKADLALAASLPGKLPVNTNLRLEVVTGPADRNLLSKGMLEFCGYLPIYNTEVFNNPSYQNGTATVKTTGRVKRQTSLTIVEFKSCLASVSQGSNDPLFYVKQGNCIGKNVNWDLKCQIRNLPRNCYYYVSCTNNQQTWPSLNQDWTCSSVHRGAQNAYCCDYKCPST